ncbi:Wzz/FepE/Etk N-terminal domain-containing protein [Staphylococcus capitis]|uniref:Wzz/FepE/Etk N-terminal domain-containing protein n=1 Tax=Staphylococcus capitis TaxID=29388 RepID=UPI000D1A3788|nr:Wzz/FepE/Etk N-terminal domain-containing protein [Staphylococcus capitis]MCC3756094.1 capsule biosynthesis protein CapA [Staphylococcus capitis]MDH8729165.1 Wzz/FepE/Etk N-terminal domain-containing protein [Staphylococcus capitis]MDH8922437.1 Wzz/FepE/Etk N-terminal domain-containing protein [Staphylococcus capitis]MDH8942552.1 Wzz/FepE/Etk N-terminal domain-containing protein [Staphylococcus capitis]MDH9593620.1 Wzz/FepE/Etk N-terminal domain-containing protein [Staphylococcus capitis]
MENTLDLTKIWEIIKKNWKILVIIPLIFLVLSAVITFFIVKPKYEASTQILVSQKEKESKMMAQEVQSNIQLVNTYAEIIKSPRVLDDVAKENKDYSADKLSKMIEVNTEADSQILNVGVKSKNEKESEKIANDVAKVFSKDVPDIMSVDNVSVLSKANGTAEKVSPKTTMNLLAGLILGLALASIIAALKEIFDKRIRTEEDVEKELGIPVLGSIQKIK